MAVRPEDYRPTVDDVAGIMRDRTYLDSVELGAFTAETNPTAEQVEGMIDRALGLVAPRLGRVDVTFVEMARSIVALRTAMLIESGLFSRESDGPEATPYAAYREQYRDALADYDGAARSHGGSMHARIASVPQSFLAAWEAQQDDAS